MELGESINEILIRFRRSLKEDGGDIELVGIEDGVLKVRITRTTVPVTFWNKKSGSSEMNEK
jgi:hypothetical protein